MTKRLWQLHSWLGLITGVFLLLIGLSGSVLVFWAEIDNAFHPDFLNVKGGAPQLSYDELFRRVREQKPEWEISD